MSKEQIENNMRFLMYGETTGRIKVEETYEGLPIIKVDLHGMNRNSACRFISNIIKINRFPFLLDIIHGYNHGTVLKEMIIHEFFSTRVANKECPSWNPGETLMKIAA